MSVNRWRGVGLATLVVALGLGAGALAQEKGEKPAAPVEKKETAAERVKRISGVLEEMRGKKFKHDVGVETQSAEDFRKFVENEIDKDLPPEKAAGMSKALQQLELLPPHYDLRKGYSDLLVSQAGAYYNPETKKFYVLMASMPDQMMEPLILHELMHAMQDQYFDLGPKMRALSAAGNDDATAAFQFLAEGEATYVQACYQIKTMGMMPDALGDMPFTQMRDMDRSQLDQQNAMVEGMLGEGAAPIKKAIAALKQMPGYLFWSLHAPYLRGQFAVYETQKKGGWKAVDELFEKPAASTEQMFHPEKLEGARPDKPIDVPIDGKKVAAALGKEWKPIFSNVLGELGVFILCDEKLPPETPEHPSRRMTVATGWGGDRYAAFEDATGQVAFVWKTKWDTDLDAKEFADAFADMKFARKPTVVRDGKDVVVDNVPDGVRGAMYDAIGFGK
jgi:hypothetical protein